MESEKHTIKLFISYSHIDEIYFKEFSRLLQYATQENNKFVWEIWDDRRIHVGNYWDPTIQDNIADCNIALLLVSIGFMSSPYIKEREFAVFKNRYANKGILIVPILFGPCDYKSWKDLNELQFFKPNGSDYGMSEVDNFSFADLFQFERNSSKILPNPNRDRYIIALISAIEKSYSHFIKIKQQIVSEPIQPDLKTSKVNSLIAYPRPSPLFSGRTTEIQSFNTLYYASRLFAIEGLGGIGKTNFVAKCIEELNIPRDKITWLNGSSSSNFDVFIECAGYSEVLRGENKSDLALFSGLKDLLERDERVIFWDNFNDYEDPTFSRFLSFCFQYLKYSTIVLITKTDPSIEGITSLPIIKLEGLEENGITYAREFKKSNTKYDFIQDSELEIICNAILGHPLAIELSISLMAYGISATEIVLHLAEYSGLKKVENFSNRLFLNILYHPRTSSEEQECLLKLSVFHELISDDEIRCLYNNSDPLPLLVGLIDKLLISFKSGYYIMHPLIRTFSYELLSDKEATHKIVADYYIKQRNTQFNGSLEEKIFHHLFKSKELAALANIIEEKGNSFIQQGKLGLISEFMNKLLSAGITRPAFDIFFGDIAQIKGDWDNSKMHFERASHSTDIIVIKAEALLKCGEIFFRKGELKEALVNFETAYEFTKSNNLKKEEARAINDIGLVYYKINKLNIANKNLTEGLNIRSEINDLEGMAVSLNNIGIIFDAKKEYKKALEFHAKSIKIATEIGDKNTLYFGFLNSSSSLKKLNKIDESIVHLNKAFELAKEIGFKEGLGVCFDAMGTILLDQGKLEESLLKHIEALKVNDEIGNKGGLASSYSNIGVIHFNYKNYEKALFNFFNSLSLIKQTGIIEPKERILSYINVIKKLIGIEKYSELASKVYSSINSEAKNYLLLKDLISETSRSISKTGRNEPCKCGSGKKYKFCHGK